MDSKASPSSDQGLELKGTYDVFLSFRGEDTRDVFVSHLHNALVQKGVHTFLDNVRLERGKPIAPELLKAIDDSKIAIVVFSKNYANSSWCLDELVHIVENKAQKLIIPVFYDVDPSDIRHQRNDVARALSQARAKGGHDKMQRWKEALKTAAGFAGWDVPTIASGNESVCVSQIVDYVHGELSRRITSTGEDLVGTDWRATKVLELLRVQDSDSVRTIGIWGIGGGGKTTTARAVFDNISHSYDGGSCFLKIAAGKSSDDDLIDLQKTLLSKILQLDKDQIDISDTRKGINMIRDRLKYKKVLIVLDNVDNRAQLRALAPDRGSLGPGSRIIITTRDNQLLNNVDGLYEVELLNKNEAMRLFIWHAFETTKPDEDFTKLSEEVVKYATGLPLALKVLGSHLEGLDLEEWSNEIRKLHKFSHDDILSVLRISYDGLDDINKKIFLDVACFFRGVDEVDVIKIINSFGFETGIKPLIRKSLVSIDDGVVEMHDLVQDMGRNVVQKQYLGSRIWNQEQFEDLIGKPECDAVEGIAFLSSEFGEFMFRNEALTRMKKLRLLCLSSNVEYTLDPESLPDGELQWLEWYQCPWESLPPRFKGRKLVGLVMIRSSIEELIRGEQRLDKLRIMELSGCEEIRQTPDFSRLPCLVELHMHNCDSLMEVHSSFGAHENLQLVDFSWCRKLKIFPKTLSMRSLKRLNLHGCSNLESFLEIGGDNMLPALEELDLSRTGIMETPDFSRIPRLVKLLMAYCDYLEEVHASFGVHENLQFVDLSWCFCLKRFPEILHMESLKHLDLSNCMRLENFPAIEGNMTALEILNLSICTGMKRLSPSIINLTGLRKLQLVGCNNMETIGHVQETSSIMAIIDAPNNTGDGFPMSTLFALKSFPQLVHLDLSWCYVTRFAIPPDCLPSLQELDLSRNPIQELVISKALLSNSLRSLNLADIEMPSRSEDNLQNQLYGDLPMVSIINYDCVDMETRTTSLDWGALTGVVRERNSELTIKTSVETSTEISTWFELDFGKDSLPCEIIISPPSNTRNTKLRGLIVYACVREEISINMKYGLQKQTDWIKSGEILFRYIPISNKCSPSCPSSETMDDKPTQQIFVLDAYAKTGDGHELTRNCDHRVQWGIGVVYEDENAEADHNINYIKDMIKVNPLNHDQDPSIFGHLKVSCNG